MTGIVRRSDKGWDELVDMMATKGWEFNKAPGLNAAFRRSDEVGRKIILWDEPDCGWFACERSTYDSEYVYDTPFFNDPWSAAMYAEVEGWTRAESVQQTPDS